MRLSRLSGATRSALRRHVLRSELYEGSGGTVWFGGSEQRAPSIAAYLGGDDVEVREQGRIRRNRIPDRIESVARTGGLAVLRLHEPDPTLAGLLRRAVTVPALVDIHIDLPDDVDTLRAQLKTSTTKEDFRRIRKANFSYRITHDPESIREFHTRHYAPLVARNFPEDGAVRSLEDMLRDLKRGGELICAEMNGDWVAGISNIVRDGEYTLRSLGIRDADHAIRQTRVTAALIVRSLERAVELGRKRATLGRSVPFLGKGPVWFKAKWGGILSRGPISRDLHMFMDLRSPAVRRMLSSSPIIHVMDDALAVSVWLEPGEEPLRVTTREAGRYPGITRWYVLGESDTIATSAEQLSAVDRIVPIPVAPTGDEPLWLGELLPRAGVDH